MLQQNHSLIENHYVVTHADTSFGERFIWILKYDLRLDWPSPIFDFELSNHNLRRIPFFILNKLSKFHLIHNR